MADTTIAVSTGTGDRLTEQLAALAPDILDRLNVDLEDSVLFIARVLGERPRATGARVTTVDTRAATMVVTDADGDHLCRLPFGSELADVDQLTAELFGFVMRARALDPDAPRTSAERAMQEMAGIRTFPTRVVAVEDLHPHLRRITLGGGDLATFAPCGPDTFLHLLVPPPGRDELTIDRSFTWAAHAEMPEDERPVGAYYTLRHWRPEEEQLDILCVLHGDAGPASAWAQRAGPGDAVALWGPRTAYAPPPDTDWYLLVADETGLPAAAAILESLPAGTAARVFAEVADESERQDLPVAPSFAVTWVYRDGAPAGTTTRLVDAVRAMPWPGGTPYVWGGGESRAMTAVRTYVRREIGLDRSAVSLVAYWRHADHAAHADDNDDE